MIKGIQLAQVVDTHPKEYAVSVYFPHMLSLAGRGIRVRVAGALFHPEAGAFELPQPGDWGLVAFYADDERSGVWIAGIPDRGWNTVPVELLQRDPGARLEQHASGRYTITESNGSSETVWPDGTALQVLTKKDGQVGNPTWIGRLWSRFVTRRRKRAWNPPEREGWEPNAQPPVDVHLKHSSGAELHLSADGSLRVKTAAGHVLELDDDTEAARDPGTGEITARADGTRAAVRVRTAGGHALTLYDGDGGNAYAELTSAGGHKLVLDDGNQKVAAETDGGRYLELSDGSSTTTVHDPNKVIVDAPVVELAGEEGQAVARVGDSVEVSINIPCPSGGACVGTATGQITSGSPKVKAE